MQGQLAPAQTARVDYEAMVRQIVTELQHQLDDPPSFRELAARVYLSPYHFHRIFRAMTGESPAELTRRLRLERAAWQVRNGDQPITDIAFAAGYATPEAFTKAFQAAFGMAPSVFRSGLRDCPGIRVANGMHFHPDGMTKFHLITRRGGPMRLEAVEMPDRRLAAVRHRGPYPEIGEAFDVLHQEVGKLDFTRDPDAIMVAVYYDDPETKPADQLDSIAAISVPDHAEIGSLEEAHLPAGKFLRAEFVGHYSGLGEAWAQLYAEHVPAGGYSLRDGVNFEVYVNDPSTTPPDQLRTDLYVPIS